VGTQISCDFPGIYVFDASKLTWQTSYNALSGADDQSHQLSQEDGEDGLAGSYGYQVPDIVQKVIGGDAAGGATVTTPAASPQGGPLATGGPITYTATISGQVVTETGISNASGGGNANSGPNIAAIVAGVIAGLLAILAGYLGFCVYAYRRQLSLYKAHVAAVHRAQTAPQNEKPPPFLAAGKMSSTEPSSHGPSSTAGGSGHQTGDESIPPVPTLHRGPSNASTADMEYQEPSFIGVLMRPRRSLRIVNRD